jgi:hypothetical protein
MAGKSYLNLLTGARPFEADGGPIPSNSVPAQQRRYARDCSG